MHPNQEGHEYIAGQLVDTIRGELDAATQVPYEGYESPPQSYLRDVARPGQWRLDAISDGFEIGDFIVIGPGTETKKRSIGSVATARSS